MPTVEPPPILDEPPAEVLADEEPPTIDPFAVTQASFISPRAVDPGSHFRAPVAVGNPGEAGIALLAKRGYFTAAIGNFTGALIKFPPTSVLLTIYVTILVPFNGTTPTLSFGKTAASAEFGGPVDLTQTQRTIKIDVTALVYPTYSMFMSAALGGATVGECIICAVFSGTPLKAWQ